MSTTNFYFFKFQLLSYVSDLIIISNAMLFVNMFFEFKNCFISI
ncbi:hypothetical protein HMPREF9088_1924 [Enterococcus italicus DSM 15952]|uniref:Uncharacterized protein n=1 Tax=Enterococcus italicus (strain DSM 15952 / CCUG 50447 / LMG 22039 / TP 1.5) TaxID=888064 RepID=E6LHT4_ENTI1|nr:hypothetical protein HMPREF9088_1924 [Enterococcus italicus DSM 15952]